METPVKRGLCLYGKIWVFELVPRWRNEILIFGQLPHGKDAP